VVLDPFVGIGSAAVAAQRCGIRRFIGFDIDAEYLAVAAEKTGAPIPALACLKSPQDSVDTTPRNGTLRRENRSKIKYPTAHT